jgi:hypothetical protein
MKENDLNSTRGISQIWLQVRKESRSFLRLLLCFGDPPGNVLHKYGNFKKKKGPKSGYFGVCFFHQNSF